MTMTAATQDRRTEALPPDEYHDFPRDEYEQRYQRVREEMRRRGLDGLLVTSEPNYRYLCGHYTQLWPNLTRPRAFLLPLHGDPVAIVGSIEVGRVKWTSWVQDIRYTSGAPKHFGFGEQTTDLVVDAVRDRGIAGGRIGAELGMQMRFGLSIADYEALTRKLGATQLVDGSELLWQVRMRKSPRELVYMRRTCDILSAAYADLLKDVAEGMTESALYRRMTIRLMEHGAERQTYIPVNFHAGNRVPPHDHLYSCDATERRLARGHIIDLDGGCTYRGYWSDWNRTFAFGPAGERARTAYRLIQETMEAGLRAVRPGVTAAEVASAFAAHLRRAGLGEHGIGRAGHGNGLTMPEPPSILEGDPTVLAPGMVLSLEPSFVLDGYGPIVGEEQVLVTDTGCELLSARASRELPIL